MRVTEQPDQHHKSGSGHANHLRGAAGAAGPGTLGSGSKTDSGCIVKPGGIPGAGQRNNSGACSSDAG